MSSALPKLASRVLRLNVGFLLKEGIGSYRVGDDVIEFGPGQADHEVINLSGHTYQAHGTVLRTPGNCVYITGYTPFRKVITIRSV